MTLFRAEQPSGDESVTSFSYVVAGAASAHSPKADVSWWDTTQWAKADVSWWDSVEQSVKADVSWWDTAERSCIAL